MTRSQHSRSILPSSTMAVGLVLLLSGAATAQETAASFQHRERADGEVWTFHRTSLLDLHTQVHLDAELVVDNSDQLQIQAVRRVETRAPQGRIPRGWRVSEPVPDDETQPKPAEVFVDRGVLATWFELPTPLFDESAWPPSIPVWKPEAALLRSAGLNERPLLWDWIPEGSLEVGTTLTVPAMLAGTLLSSEDLVVGHMEATLTEVREDGEVLFQVRAQLVGQADPGPTNSIPSETRVDLEGTWTLDSRSTRPRLLDLSGAMRIAGQGQQEDLSVRIAGEGFWHLQLSWVEGA